MEAIVLCVLFSLVGLIGQYGWWLATKEITNEELREVRL